MSLTYIRTSISSENWLQLGENDTNLCFFIAEDEYGWSTGGPRYTHWHVSTFVYKWWHLADYRVFFGKIVSFWCFVGKCFCPLIEKCLMTPMVLQPNIWKSAKSNFWIQKWNREWSNSPNTAWLGCSSSPFFKSFLMFFKRTIGHGKHLLALCLSFFVEGSLNKGSDKHSLHQLKYTLRN